MEQQTEAPAGVERQQPGRFSDLANRPSIHLVYLIFLYMPWLFVTPRTVDIVVALLATAVFLPLHYACFRSEPPKKLWYIGGIAALGVLTAPFITGHSVFHIYAAASAGYLRPSKVSAITLVLCLLVYLASASYFDRHIIEISFGLLFSIIVWVSTFSAAEAQLDHQRAERSRALDVQQASLIERERLARDLHDLLGHTLTLVSLKSDLAGRLMETDQDAARAELKSIQTTSRQALKDVRETLSGLTVTSVADELKNAEIALEAAQVRLTVEGHCPVLEGEQDTAFGLMLREAVTNIIRHSSATDVTITFAREDDVYSLVVADNGEVGNINEGNGLGGLRARLEGLGGMLSVSDSTGCKVSAMLPA